VDKEWEIWCEHFGKPSGEHSMPPLPSSDPDWGVWGLVPVPADTWWAAADKT
jgi:hypothetical protein